MTDADQQQIDRIEKDRRRRERELLILMLLLIGDTRRHAVYAAKMGHDPLLAARNVWLGNTALEQPGAAPVIAEQMAHAELDGMKRAIQLARSNAPTGATMPSVKSVTADEATFDRIAAKYAQDASDFASRTWGVIEQKLSPAIAGAVQDGIAATIKAIRLAFKDAGVTKSDPSTLEKGIERQVVPVYNVGLWNGAHSIIDPKHHLAGFQHVSVIDSGTTDICRERNGLILEPDDAYWKNNWPGLHWGCRSIIYPLFGESVTPSTRLPTIPPAPGFGLAPSTDLGSYFGVAR